MNIGFLLLSRNPIYQELIKESNQTAAKMLEPGQAKRLRQISLQVQGPGVFTDPQLSQELSLTEEQRQKIGKIVQEADQQMMPLIQPGIAPEEAKQKMGELYKNARHKILKLMTAEQQTKWKEMTGEPFHGPIDRGLPDTQGTRVSP